MKKFYLILLLNWSAFYSYAQVSAKIVYTYEHAGLEYKHDFTLYVLNELYHYAHHATPTEYVTSKEFEIVRGQDYYDWVYNSQTKKVQEKRTLENGTILLAGWEEDIKWTITEETKQIGEYTVQKAVALSHNTQGRGEWDLGNVIAWFTTEIPIPAGPERYVGLPGLIVRLEFSERSMTCTLKEVTLNEEQNHETPDLSCVEGIKVTKQQTFMPFAIDRKWLKKEHKKNN